MTLTEASRTSSGETSTERRSRWLSPREWFRWVPTSPELLEKVEEKILTCCKNISEQKFVSGKVNKLWTIVVNKEKEKEKTPIVMVHGFGGGVGLWIHNLDSLSEKRTVYAFDLLGFGRSSRPVFSHDPELAENEFIDAIEEWRKSLNLEKFILIGHSLGAFLASSYTIKYPKSVQHLILADAWGFPEKAPASQQQGRLPSWIRLLVKVLTPFNPLAGLRAAGPWGPGLVKRFRPDLQDTFSEVFDDDTIFTYIYHCNAQTPSGECAFKNMTIPFGWAKYPMINRISELPSHLPMTMIYGSRSWIDRSIGHRVKYIRNDSFVDVQIVVGAGHHVYADKPEIFNNIVNRICDKIDSEAEDKLRQNSSVAENLSSAQNDSTEENDNQAQDTEDKDYMAQL
ncbi:hypothetical protein LOTGIDRAFT_219704 [Lottia gigantea]|uniref:1-acylglycerol-3-phosphate O-acyltransferase ABHD5 n=1 Tax=Lottia gigantea TaxID=225164 RepID=V3ZTT6_LOTGI|nr:hypothetical protein LOTGIDRAFT_219704 [Lottia gigantea]ESO87802.1 hypothetical protein LOTGIDRAFT_219704 [Lottia gigantea]